MLRTVSEAFGRRSLIETDGQASVGIINDDERRADGQEGESASNDRVIDVAFTAGATTPLRRYTHSDNVDEPLQLETFDAAGAFDARYSYHADHLGSIRFLTDALGEVANAYDYDSYGQEVVAMEGVEQPFRFTGREWDEAAKLYHYRARAYDPSTGMFIQEDPIWFQAGDLNVQRYVGNNPINFIDPTGLNGVGTHTAPATSVGAGLVGAAIGCLMNQAWQGVQAAGRGTDYIILPCGVVVSGNPGPIFLPADKAPGYPDGLHPDYVPPKGGRPKKVPTPRGYGWPDKKGNVWVPTGTGGGAHGGPHWDVQGARGGYNNKYPDGRPDSGGKKGKDGKIPLRKK